MHSSPCLFPSGEREQEGEIYTFSPCLIPFSMKTSTIFCSSTTFCPQHRGHLSSSSMTWPVPRQSGHGTCICCTIPGAICRTWIFTPVPLQDLQVVDFPLFDPVPRHFGQMTFRRRESFLMYEPYMSSNDTRRGWTTSSPLLGPDRLPGTSAGFPTPAKHTGQARKS